MGLVYLKNEEKRIYEAYGMTVYGKQDRYTWSIYPDKPDENVFTMLRIEKDGNNLLDIQLGNRCIFEENFNRTIDNFLWWIEKDKPDSYSIENAVFKNLCETNSLFNHLIGNRKRKEKAEADEITRVAAIREEKEKQKETIKDYCKKKGYVFKETYKKSYLIKPLNEKAKTVIESAEEKVFDSLVEFMTEHPNNTDAVIVMSGSVEELLEGNGINGNHQKRI